VHLVDEEYDHGPIVLQTSCAVEEDDTPDTLAARVLKHEHATYTNAVALFAAGRLKIEAAVVRILPEATCGQWTVNSVQSTGTRRCCSLSTAIIVHLLPSCIRGEEGFAVYTLLIVKPIVGAGRAARRSASS